MKKFRKWMIENESEAVYILLMCGRAERNKQLKQIESVLNNFTIEVYDNFIETKEGCFLSITVDKMYKNELLQYLRSVRNKTLGWEVKE